MKRIKYANDIDGMIILNKPKNITSNDCLSIIKKILQPTKIGHTGTLDKNATGVLVCLLGTSTKCQEFLMKSKNKIYEAELILGIDTDTEDITGNVLNYIKIDFDHFNIEDLKSVVNSFIGEYNQIPPMYSAKKIDGKKLLDLARKGIVKHRNACKVVINNLVIKSYENFNIDDKNLLKINLYVDCSKGTYIRTLCKDIGIKLGVPACMGNLNRVATGEFRIENSVTLEIIREKVSNNDFSFIKPCFYQEFNSVVTFGKFETLHIGHQKIINKLVSLAKDNSLKSVVIIVGNNNASKILSNEQRITKLKNLGVDSIINLKLNDNIKSISANDFINDIIYNQIKAKAVVVGSDCSFGYKGEGNSKILKDICHNLGIDVYVIDKLKIENTNIEISSTLIKKEYDNGNLTLVNKLLGNKEVL